MAHMSVLDCGRLDTAALKLRQRHLLQGWHRRQCSSRLWTAYRNIGRWRCNLPFVAISAGRDAICTQKNSSNRADAKVWSLPTTVAPALRWRSRTGPGACARFRV